MNLTINSIRPVQTQVTPSLNDFSIFTNKILCLDFETTSLDWWKPGERAVYASVTSSESTSVFTPLADEFYKRIKEFLLDETNTLIGQNIKFDLHWIGLTVDELKCSIIDTAVGLFLLDENKEIGLKKSVERIFGYKPRNFKSVLGKVREEVPDSTTKKGTRVKTRSRTLEEVPTEEVIQYVCEDSYWTWTLWFNYVKPNLHKYPELERNFYDIQMPLSKVLWAMEERGVEVDVEAAKSLMDLYSERIGATEDRIRSCKVDKLVNLSSPMQVDNLLYNTLGYNRPPFKAKRKDKQGNKIESKYDTGHHALLWLAVEHGYEIPKLLLERRKYEKYNSTYLKPIIECSVNGRLHTNYNQTGTKTGRLSSSNPINLQNIPRNKEIRGLFRAKEGSKLLVMDLAQAELRILAHCSQDQNLIQSFKDGSDLHWDTAVATGLSDILEHDEARFCGKTANFSMAYGVWIETFRNTLYEDSEGKINLTQEQSKGVLERLNEERFTGVAEWKKEVIQGLKANGYVQSIDGRKRRLPQVHTNNWKGRSYAERQGVNAIVQGTVGDIINRIMADAWYDICLKYQVLQVHDELVIEHPMVETQVGEDITELEFMINDYYKLTIPIQIGYNVSDRWEK